MDLLPRLDLPRLPLLVGFSGGADSVALLDLLWRARAAGGGPRVAAAHLNHAIRGADADADAAFCRDFCRERGIPFFVARVDVPAAARAAKMNLEAAARAARQAFLARVCAENGFAGAALAHHADDQAETVFLRLMRGAGWRGLSGMAARAELEVAPFPPPPGAGAETSMPQGTTPLTVFRPLLGATKAEIVAYARERGLPWREDASNRDPAYARNWLRQRFFPILAALYPDYRERLLAFAATARAADDAAAREAWKAWREWGGVFVAFPPGFAPGFPAGTARGETTERAAAALARALAPFRPALRRRDYAAIAQVLTGAAPTANLTHGWRLRRDGDGCFALPPHSTGTTPPAPWETQSFLAPPFALETADFTLRAELVTLNALGGGVPERDDPGVEYFDPAALRWPLAVRPPRPGEKMRPVRNHDDGGNGDDEGEDEKGEGTKLSALAASAPGRCRAALPVLADGGGALWLAPLRRARRALLAPPAGGAAGTVAALRVECRLKHGANVNAGETNNRA